MQSLRFSAVAFRPSDFGGDLSKDTVSKPSRPSQGRVGILLEVWESCIAWTDEDSKRQISQDEIGRLWDLLNVLRVKAKTCSGDTVRFTLTRVPRDGKSELPQDITLKAVIGPGDDLKPVITVMLPDQD